MKFARFTGIAIAAAPARTRIHRRPFSLGLIATEAGAGIAGAIYVLPSILSAGSVLYQPLGPAFVATGIAAAFMTTTVAAAMVSALSGPPFLLNSPKTTHAIVLSSVLAPTLALPAFAGPGVSAGAAASAAIVASLMALIVAGLVQMVLGASRMGRIVRFLPHPVLIGLLNGFALQIILNQFPRTLGLTSAQDVLALLPGAGGINAWALAFAALAGGVAYLTRRLTSFIPGALLGLVAGTLAQALAGCFVDPQSLGPVIGALPGGIPFVTHLDELWALASQPGILSLLPSILVTGITLAVLLSIHTLMHFAGADSKFGTSHDSNKELIVQGAANGMCGLMGGGPIAPSINVTNVVHASGGHTRGAMLSHAAILFIVASSFSWLLTYLPLSVLAGVVIASTGGAADAWSTKLTRRLFSAQTGAERLEIAAELAPVAIVAALVVSVGVVTAVAVGIVVSLLAVVRRTCGSIVEKIDDGSEVTSSVARSASEAKVLENCRQQIVVISLRGQLYFASAAVMSRRVETELRRRAALETGHWVILDLSRVSDIDVTAALAIKRLDAAVRRSGGTLLLVLPSGHQRGIFHHVNYSTTEAHHKFFNGVDDAVQSAEDALLTRFTCRNGNTPAPAHRADARACAL